MCVHCVWRALSACVLCVLCVLMGCALGARATSRQTGVHLCINKRCWRNKLCCTWSHHVNLLHFLAMQWLRVGARAHAAPDANVKFFRLVKFWDVAVNVVCVCCVLLVCMRCVLPCCWLKRGTNVLGRERDASRDHKKRTLNPNRVKVWAVSGWGFSGNASARLGVLYTRARDQCSAKP